MRRAWIAITVVVIAGASCVIGDAGADAAVQQLADSGPQVVCPLGSVYQGQPVIDPDSPLYQDNSWSQAEVEQAFAAAKAANDSAYRAYRAAYRTPALLECAFCSCGCDTLVSHQSAVDCFKDMHGFG